MNLKFKAPALDKIKLNSPYAITINPEIQPKKIEKKQVYEWYRQMWDNWREKKVSLELYLEASPTGRMHFHGFIEATDYVKYIDFIKVLQSTTAGEVDTIEKKEVFKEYCIKQKHIWESFLNDSVIGYPMRITGEASLIKGCKEVKEEKGAKPPISSLKTSKVQKQIDKLLNKEMG